MTQTLFLEMGRIQTDGGSVEMVLLLLFVMAFALWQVRKLEP